MNSRLLVTSHASLLFSGKLSKGRRLSHIRSVASTDDRFVGSLYCELTVSEATPYETANMKVLYPATANFGIVCRDPSEGHFPVVLFFPGAEVESIRYQWLGEKLVLNAGVVFVCYNHIASLVGDSLLLNPYFSKNGTQILPSSTIQSLLNKLTELNNTGILAGKLDLDRVIIGGHSVGGHLALRGADSEVVPSLKGVFTYGAPNTMDLPGGPQTGESILPLPGTVPHLLIEGTRDGLLQSARNPNATNSDDTSVPISETFLEGLFEGRAACYVELDGSNHNDILNPVDQTSPNIARDFDSTIDKEQMEQLLAQIITAFVQNRLSDNASAFQDIESTLTCNDDLLSKIECNFDGNFDCNT